MFYSTGHRPKFVFKFINKDYPVSNIELDLTRLTKIYFTDMKGLGLQFVSVIANIKQVDGNRYTLGNRFPVYLNDPDSQAAYIDYLNNKYAVLDARDRAVKAETIYYNYASVTEELYTNSKFRIANRIEATKVINNVDFRNEIPANLPANTDYSTWGSRFKWLDSKTLKVMDLKIDQAQSIVSRYIVATYLEAKTINVEIFSSTINTKVQKFIDTTISAVNDEFIRKVGDRYFYFLNGKVRFIYEKLFISKKDQISKGRTDKKSSLNIITLDIETFVNSDRKMDLLCLSYYDGSKTDSFYISDYNSVKELKNAALKKLFVKANSNKKIYIHNSSNFDLVFILKHIANYPGVNLEPIIRDGQFIDLKIKYGSKKEFVINMRDSFLLLPVSLRSLAKQFNVDVLKGNFPFEFVTKDKINYIGKVPNLKFFQDLSEKEYNSYKQNFVNKDWSLKTEVIKYCEQDCVFLYKVINTFANQIYVSFQLNVSNVATFPSLAFKIFKVHYLSKSVEFPVLSGRV